MARHGGRSRGGSRLAKARVEWLPVADNLVVGTLTSVDETLNDELYDFSGAVSEAAVDFGSGDWTLERTIVQGGACSVGTVETNTLIMVCLGIGQLNPATAVSASIAG